MAGELTVITGPMGSGKTLELIKLLSKHERAGYTGHVFKHIIDVRDAGDLCRSRAGLSIPARTVEGLASVRAELLGLAGNQIIAFEEGQFFDEELVDLVCEVAAKTEHKMVVTGLNQNFRGKPFGIMPTLLAIADDIRLLTAICDVCHGPATKTQRIINGKPASADSPDILIGGDEQYVARCASDWVAPM